MANSHIVGGRQYPGFNNETVTQQIITPFGFLDVAVAGGNVTVALTGNVSTAAQGTLGVQNAHALTGNASTASEGSIRGGQPLHGNQITASQGTLTPKITVALTGNAMTASEGTLVPVTGVTVAITGNSSTAAQGTLGVKHANLLTGNQNAAFEGTLTPSQSGNVSVALTGISMTMFQGTITASAPIVIVDTHDGDNKKHEKKRRKRIEEERHRNDRRRQQIIDAFEQIIDGNVSRETNIEQVIAPAAEMAVKSPEIQQKSDFDFSKWLTNLDNAQRILDDYLEADDEDSLLLL